SVPDVSTLMSSADVSWTLLEGGHCSSVLDFREDTPLDAFSQQPPRAEGSSSTDSSLAPAGPGRESRAEACHSLPLQSQHPCFYYLQTAGKKRGFLAPPTA
ncbi:hypothetical protein H1C71_000104, partial [Ictidomys tridecemlineatus]